MKRSTTSRGRRLRVENLEARNLLATIVVDTHLDTTGGDISSIQALMQDKGPDDKISLREAIEAANNTFNAGGPDRIEFLTTLPDIALTMSDLVIRDSLIIKGIGRNDQTIQADTGHRIFTITDATVDFTLSDMTLTGGDTFSSGGAISTAGALTLENMRLHNNESGFRGGAINATGTNLTLLNTIINNNTSSSNGGGVYFFSEDAATVIFDTVTIEDNISNNSGGGFRADADATSIHITNSAFRRNTGGSGAGLSFRADDESSIAIERTTVADNIGIAVGNHGGGIAADLFRSSTLFVSDSIVTGNTSQGTGGGISAYTNDILPGSENVLSVHIARSLISGNTSEERGGGIFALLRDGADALIEDVHVNDNTANARNESLETHGNGGGIYAFNLGTTGGTRPPEFTISRSTIENNQAEKRGGGIFVCGKHVGSFLAENSTVSGNRTRDDSEDVGYYGEPTGQMNGRGGGVFVGRIAANENVDAYFRNVTITENKSDFGGGLEVEDIAQLRVRLANTIISNNTDHDNAPDNVLGRLDTAAAKYNFIGTGSQILNLSGTPNGQTGWLDSTNVISDTPKLNPLADNGGTVRLGITGYYPPTHLPMSDSDVIDRGSDAFAVSPLTTVAFSADQRGEGFTRYYDDPIHANEVGLTDIGAIERLVTSLASVVNVIIADGDPAASGTIAYDLKDFLTGTQDGEEQLEPVPVPKLDTFLIQFSEDVSASLAALNQNGVNGPSVGLLGLINGGIPTYVPSSYSYDTTTNTATWEFSGVGHDEHYLLYLKDDITNAAGRHLDGEWANPASYTNPPSSAAVSNFATGNGSGNGAEGGDFAFVFRTLLFGDADNDGSVSGSDLLAVTNNFSSTGPADGILLGDADDDGVVAGSDLLAVTNNFGSFLKDDIALLLDLDNDGDVDAEDFAEYLSNSRDLNGDGNIGDAADDAIRDGYEDFWMAFGDLEVELAYAWL